MCVYVCWLKTVSQPFPFPMDGKRLRELGWRGVQQRLRAVMGKSHPQTEPEHSQRRVYISEWHVTPHHNLVVSINLQKVQNCLAKSQGTKSFKIQNTYFLMPMKGWLMDWL